jgi:hypothetical protein
VKASKLPLKTAETIAREPKDKQASLVQSAGTPKRNDRKKDTALFELHEANVSAGKVTLALNRLLTSPGKKSVETVFLILKCLSSAAQSMSLMALDVPGMHLSMSVATNVCAKFRFHHLLGRLVALFCGGYLVRIWVQIPWCVADSTVCDHRLQLGRHLNHRITTRHRSLACIIAAKSPRWIRPDKFERRRTGQERHKPQQVTGRVIQFRKSRNWAGIFVPPLLVADKSRLFAFDVSEVDFIPLAMTMAYFAQA